MIGRLPLEQDLASGLEALPPHARWALYRVLAEREGARARSIGALWADERTRGLAELLIDIEVAPEIRLLMLEILREV